MIEAVQLLRDDTAKRLKLKEEQKRALEQNAPDRPWPEALRTGQIHELRRMVELLDALLEYAREDSRI